MSGYGKDQEQYVYDAAATRPNQASSYQGPAQPSFASQYTEASVRLPHEQSGVDMPYIPSSTYESRGETSYSTSNSFIDARSRHPAATPETEPEVTNVISPSHGTAGSTVLLHIRTKIDYEHDSEPNIFAFMFGTQRCQATLRKQNPENDWYNYILSVQVPPFPMTKQFDPTMTVKLRLEDKNFQVLSETDAGKFTFTDMSPALTYQPTSDLVKKRRFSDAESEEYAENPAKRQNTMRPQAKSRSLSAAYSAPLSPLRVQQSISNAYGGYSSGYDLSTVKQSGYDLSGAKQAGYSTPQLPHKGLYAVHSGTGMSQTYMRPPQMSPGLASYGHYGSMTQRSPGSMAAVPVRASAMASSATVPTPVLVRATTLSQTGSSTTSPRFNPYLMYPSKAILKIEGDLDSMTEHWTPEEVEAKRRLVQFERSQSGSTITTKFAPVAPEARPARSICVSCIFWEEKGDCYITSVDTIYLLEQLVNVRFTVEEKNRIRRNLEGFRPCTVSKAKAESEEFFKVIMGFPNPKPRNIEKDVKVFPWKILSHALKKIISKYTASYSSTAGAGSLPPVHTPSYLPVGLSQATGDPRRNESPRSILSLPFASSITSSSMSPNMRASAGLEGSGGHGMSVAQRDSTAQGMSQWTTTHHQAPQYGAGRGSWDYGTYLDNPSVTAADIPSAAQPMHMQRSNVTPDISQMPSSDPYQQYGQGTSRV